MGIHHYFKSLSDLEKINRCPERFELTAITERMIEESKNR